MVLLEGMSAGLIPVCSDLPGLGDVVGDTGRVVPRRDPDAPWGAGIVGRSTGRTGTVEQSGSGTGGHVHLGTVGCGLRGRSRYRRSFQRRPGA